MKKKKALMPNIATPQAELIPVSPALPVWGPSQKLTFKYDEKEGKYCADQMVTVQGRLPTQILLTAEEILQLADFVKKHQRSLKKKRPAVLININSIADDLE